MHLDRVILRMYRRSDGLSTIPDNHNKITHQSDNTNDAPKDPLHVPVTHTRDDEASIKVSTVRAYCLPTPHNLQQK